VLKIASGNDDRILSLKTNSLLAISNINRIIDEIFIIKYSSIEFYSPFLFVCYDPHQANNCSQ
jgi:hypothetical protein